MGACVCVCGCVRDSRVMSVGCRVRPCRAVAYTCLLHGGDVGFGCIAAGGCRVVDAKKEASMRFWPRVGSMGDACALPRACVREERGERDKERERERER